MQFHAASWNLKAATHMSIWHGEASEASVDLQAYGGNPTGQHRVLSTFGHHELSIHPAGTPLPGFSAGTSKLFVLTCKR